MLKYVGYCVKECVRGVRRQPEPRQVIATAGNMLNQTLFLMEGKIILCSRYAAYEAVWTHKYHYCINEDIMMNGIETFLYCKLLT